MNIKAQQELWIFLLGISLIGLIYHNFTLSVNQKDLFSKRLTIQGNPIYEENSNGKFLVFHTKEHPTWQFKCYNSSFSALNI
jgi:hypothetical protein